MIRQMTPEEWAGVAERLGEEAEKTDRFIEEASEIYPEAPGCSTMEQHADDLRVAAAALLWVSENAAWEIRFEIRGNGEEKANEEEEQHESI